MEAYAHEASRTIQIEVTRNIFQRTAIIKIDEFSTVINTIMSLLVIFRVVYYVIMR